MYLPLTSIKDAWGVSSLEEEKPVKNANAIKSDDTINQHSLLNSASQLNEHPNYITNTTPTRVDVSIFDKDLVVALSQMSPQDRTLFVSNQLRNKETQLQIKTQIQPQGDTMEYYRPLTNNNDNIKPTDSVHLWRLVTFVMILMLIDKLLSIWKNS
jgi:hypothetical protein